MLMYLRRLCPPQHPEVVALEERTLFRVSRAQEEGRRNLCLTSEFLGAAKRVKVNEKSFPDVNLLMYRVRVILLLISPGGK